MFESCNEQEHEDLKKIGIKFEDILEAYKKYLYPRL